MASNTEVLAGQLGGARKRRPLLLDVFVRLIRTKPLGTIGLVITIVLFTTATFADAIAPQWYNVPNVDIRLQPPGTEYLLGTDQLGRDVFSRLVYGARISIYVGFGSVALAMVVAYVIGMTTAYYGGWLYQIFMRVVDGWLAIPTIVFLIALGTVFPAGIMTIIIILGINFAMRNSRVIRGQVLTIQENVYVEAAKALGARHLRTMLVHILPNTFAPVIILATGELASAILAETSLSYLGLGIPPPFPSWGGMIGGDTRSYMYQAPWMVLWPGVALSLVVFAWNMLGDALRDLLDPRLRTG